MTEKRYEGKKLSVMFLAERCIHARHCVLSLPKVFLANTDGDWIVPDNADSEELKRVIRNCPSGALKYSEQGSSEPSTEVNTIRIWENGPYALNAEIDDSKIGSQIRTTLCRCGESKNKPLCDGTHKETKFIATGEPEAIEFEALKKRDGKIKIDPKKDGPLFLLGNIEVVSGTGKTINKAQEVHLCRCGHSKNKPYCDGEHVKVGFKAE